MTQKFSDLDRQYNLIFAKLRAAHRTRDDRARIEQLQRLNNMMIERLQKGGAS